MNRTATVMPSHGPGPGPGPAPLGDSPEAQAGARGTEKGTGGESKEEEEEGQPSPLSREDCRGYSAFQYILHSQAPETNRCASRLATTASALRASAAPQPGGRALKLRNFPEKIGRHTASNHW